MIRNLGFLDLDEWLIIAFLLSLIIATAEGVVYLIIKVLRDERNGNIRKNNIA